MVALEDIKVDGSFATQGNQVGRHNYMTMHNMFCMIYKIFCMTYISFAIYAICCTIVQSK